MFNDTISEVEKLNAVQQLTFTITPLSMVNMMMNNKDECFQCQEHGHIAYTLGVLNVMTTVTL